MAVASCPSALFFLCGLDCGERSPLSTLWTAAIRPTPPPQTLRRAGGCGPSASASLAGAGSSAATTHGGLVGTILAHCTNGALADDRFLDGSVPLALSTLPSTYRGSRRGVLWALRLAHYPQATPMRVKKEQGGLIRGTPRLGLVDVSDHEMKTTRHLEALWTLDDVFHISPVFRSSLLEMTSLVVVRTCQANRWLERTIFREGARSLRSRIFTLSLSVAMTSTELYEGEKE